MASSQHKTLSELMWSSGLSRAAFTIFIASKRGSLSWSAQLRMCDQKWREERCKINQILVESLIVLLYSSLTPCTLHSECVPSWEPDSWKAFWDYFLIWTLPPLANMFNSYTEMDVWSQGPNVPMLSLRVARGPLCVSPIGPLPTLESFHTVLSRATFYKSFPLGRIYISGAPSVKAWMVAHCICVIVNNLRRWETWEREHHVALLED